MLEVFEYKNIITYPEEGKILIRTLEGEKIEIKAISGYLIWLNLYPSKSLYDKPILELWLSPHQLGRIAKYFGSGNWQGGIICPSRSNPEGCSIDELNDQSKYLRILDEISHHRVNIEKYKDAPAYMTDYDRKIISRLEADALLLKKSTRFGIEFHFLFAKPRMSITWLQDDPKTVASEFFKVVKLAYSMREPEPERVTDLSKWKQRLFEV